MHLSLKAHDSFGEGSLRINDYYQAPPRRHRRDRKEQENPRKVRVDQPHFHGKENIEACLDWEMRVEKLFASHKERRKEKYKRKERKSKGKLQKKKKKSMRKPLRNKRRGRRVLLATRSFNKTKDLKIPLKIRVLLNNLKALPFVKEHLQA